MIYYKGYVVRLANDDPEKFEFEFAEFLNNYSSGF